MRPAFVQTQNYHRFMGALSALSARGAEECRLIVVDGLPGLGKTTILERWAGLQSCVFLRAKTEWSPYWLMEELLEWCKAPVPHGHGPRFNACLGALAEKAKLALQSGREFVVVIDEADHVTSRAKLVDTIRDLTDLSGVPFVLVGMGKIRDNLTRYPQTASRISRYVRFEPADLADVQLFLATQCEVPVAECLAKFVLVATKGYNREIREAIVAIEKFGFRHAPKGDGLMLAEMAGQHLINDRKSGQALMVPTVMGEIA